MRKSKLRRRTNISPTACQACRSNALKPGSPSLPKTDEGCCSLPDHHVAVQRKLDVRVEDRATIFQWLQEFVARGLFVSLDDLVGRLGSVPHASSASFAGIAIRTCDRPALLARLLRSVA